MAVTSGPLRIDKTAAVSQVKPNVWMIVHPPWVCVLYEIANISGTLCGCCREFRWITPLEGWSKKQREVVKLP